MGKSAQYEKKRQRNLPFGNRLKQTVAEEGCSYREFAKRCGLNGDAGYQQLIFWMNGDRAPGLHSLATLAKALPNTNLRHLVCGATEPEEEEFI